MWYVSSQRPEIQIQIQACEQVRRVELGGDCSMDYRDQSQTLRVSLAGDMIRIALSRRQCEDSRFDVPLRETDRVSTIPAHVRVMEDVIVAH